MNVQIDVSFAGHRAVGIAGKRDEESAFPLDCGNDGEYFGRAPRVRDADYDILTGDHAKVTMRCFGGMNKESGGPGGSHCGCNLAGNMAAFSDTRDDDAAAAGEERLHGPDEVISDAVRKSRYRGGFNFQNFLCQRESLGR